jgi:hypothetical protein
MLKFALRTGLLAGLLMFYPAFAMAKSYTIPNPDPVAVITIPDSWETKELAYGLETTTEDEEYYLLIEVTDKRTAEKDVTKTLEWLLAKGVSIDPATQKEQAFSLNGMEGFILYWDGKDADGPTQVSISLLQLNENKGLVITGWGTVDGQKENLKELTEVLNSLRAVK